MIGIQITLQKKCVLEEGMVFFPPFKFKEKERTGNWITKSRHPDTCLLEHASSGHAQTLNVETAEISCPAGP